MSKKGRGGIGDTIVNLFKWIKGSAEWSDHLEAVMDDHLAKAIEESGLDRDAVMGGLGSDRHTTLFGCAMEDLASRVFEKEPHNLVDDYLKRRGWRETPRGRRYLEGLRDTAMSLYEVVSVHPGHSVEVRDLLRRGQTVQVTEHLGSQEMAKWDCVAARVLPDVDRHIFSGVLLPISRDSADRLVEAVQSAFSEMLSSKTPKIVREVLSDPEITDVIVRGLAPTFTTFWLARVLTPTARSIPEMVNFDGDPIQFCEVTFPVHEGAAGQIAERLASVAGLESGGDGEHWSWVVEGPADPSAGQGLREGKRSYGDLSLRGDNLVLFTNSRRRAEQGKELLESALAGLVDAPLTSIKSVQQALAEHTGAPADGKALPPEQEAGIIEEVYQRHYRAWPDQGIPALDGQTPRQAVRTAAGRKKVVALLKDFENREDRLSRSKGTRPFDFGWLWAELGLSRDD